MKKRLFILDPSIRDQTGHYLSYALKVSLAAESLGFNTYIITNDNMIKYNYSNKIAICPFFDRHVWEQFPGELGGRDQEFREASAWLESSIRELHRQFQFTFDDHLLWPTVTPRQVPGLVSTFTSRDFCHIHSELLIRYQAEWYEHPAVMASFELLENTPCRLILSSDSNLLARQLGVITSVPVLVRPIPHVHDETTVLRNGVLDTCDSPLVISMLGNAREEKGFVVLLQALPLIAALHNHERPLRFVIQCNDPDPLSQDALNEFSVVHGLDVEWISEALSDQDYDLRVEQSTLVLAPYNQHVYRARTSGIGLDALLHGVPLVATEGTWLARSLPRLAIQVMQSQTVLQLSSAVLGAIARIDQLGCAARDVQREVVRVHNAVQFVRQMTGISDSFREFAGKRRALIIYPWGNASSDKAGASSRVHMLVDYLERNGQCVRVISAGGTETRIGEETWIEAHDDSRWAKESWQGSLTGIGESLLTWFGAENNVTSHIMRYIQWRSDHRWMNRLREAMEWADDAYLEYPFFAETISDLSLRYSTNLWLTNYDIIHKNIKNSLLQEIVKILEVGGNRAVDQRACVTATECETLASLGIQTKHIPNVIRSSLADWKEIDDQHIIVTQLLGRDSRDVKIVFFVGSNYQPNIQAARAIRAMAMQISTDEKHVCFVVAGACWNAETAERFVSLGEIDAVSLQAIYAISSIVLNPVQEGTGSAIKMLEALAHGKCIISTSVGARGHDLHNGVECVIEDDLDAFPARIEQWLDPSPEKSAIELRARLRGRENDYMIVFPKYSTDLNSEWHGPGRPVERETERATVDYSQLLTTPLLAGNRVVAALVERRGAHSRELAVRRLFEKLVSTLQPEAVTSLEYLRVLAQIPSNILVEPLLSALLSMPRCNRETLRFLIRHLEASAAPDQDQYTKTLFKELSWLLRRLGYIDIATEVKLH